MPGTFPKICNSKIPTPCCLILSQWGIGDTHPSGIKVALAMKATDRKILIDRIRDIDGFTDEERATLIEFLSEKKYGLIWEETTENVEKKLALNYPTLKEVKDHAIISDNTDAPNHVLIEGDNLEALTALTFTHEGCIDVIYIDPPYNTGNRDFKYNDTYVNPDNEFRHSMWLSFMSKRLKIAQKLLSPRGVIFISIDDNEQANLKLLCDEIFGQQNFIANIIWEKKYTIANDAKYFSDNHDFILCYAGNKPSFVIGELPRTEEMDSAYKNPDNHPKGPWKSTPLHARSGTDTSFTYTFKNGVTFRPPSGRFSAYSAETLKQLDENNEIWFGVHGDSVPSRKTFLCELKKQGVVPRTIIPFSLGGHNHEADEEVKGIFHAKIFTSPKPTKLIKLLLTISNLKDAIILDFFAGSGTTLHAVMHLNSEDGGKRQCILCQGIELDDSGQDRKIAENVTYERNKRVINGYTKQNGEFVEGLHDNNLRYYRIDYVSRDNMQKNRRLLAEKAAEMLCIKEDLYDEKKTFGSITLDPRGARYFDNGKNNMLIIYIPEFVHRFVEEIDKMTIERPIKIFVYSPGRYAYDDDFAIVADKVTLCAFPQNIIDAISRARSYEDIEVAEDNESKEKIMPQC